MRIESSTPSATGPSRWRGAIDGARRRVGRTGRGGRVVAIGVAIALAAIVGIGLRAMPADREETEWLYDGKSFSDEAALDVEQALAAEKIAFRTDASKRVGVVKASWPQAIAALEKHGVERPSLDEIGRAREAAGSWWEGQAERSDREHRLVERELKAIIEGYEGVRSAHVRVKRTPIRGGLRPSWNLSGLVVLNVDRRPPHKTILAIRALLAAEFAELKPDAVTISDQTGRFYLKAGDPASVSVTERSARAEELRDALIDNLAPSIRGIDVVVQVEPIAATDPNPTPAPNPAPGRAAPPPPAPPAEEVRPASSVNSPLEIGADPEPAPRPSPAPDAAEPAPGRPRANVWAKVPRSYYLGVFRDNVPNKQPSAEDLIPYLNKTRELVENAVAMLVPAAERGRVLVSTIHDDLGAAGPLFRPGGSDASARALPSWAPTVAIGTAVGLGVALVFGTGFGMMAARRPSARPSRSTVRSGLAVDAPTGPVPGPSERVRDLVRRDPEAAAGVLQRWIGRGDGGPTG